MHCARTDALSPDRHQHAFPDMPHSSAARGATRPISATPAVHRRTRRIPHPKISAVRRGVWRYSPGVSNLFLHTLHEGFKSARFARVNGEEVVEDYGDIAAEHAAFASTVGVVDLSFRSRLCITGADRSRFLHGQVTNNVKDLQPGQGCYAALVTAKGKLQSDLNIYCLRDELLLDFEPGLTARVRERLEHFVVADDVQVVEVAPHYGLLGVLGPGAAQLIRQSGFNWTLPKLPLSSVTISDPAQGEIIIVNQARGAHQGFDLFVPLTALEAVAKSLMTTAGSSGGRAW